MCVRKQTKREGTLMRRAGSSTLSRNWRQEEPRIVWIFEAVLSEASSAMSLPFPPGAVPQCQRCWDMSQPASLSRASVNRGVVLLIFTSFSLVYIFFIFPFPSFLSLFLFFIIRMFDLFFLPFLFMFLSCSYIFFFSCFCFSSSSYFSIMFWFFD